MPKEITMPRKKKTEEVVVAETPKKRTKKVKEVEPVLELTPRPVEQFEIDWDKIKEQVREAAEMIENPTKIK
jgi:hypothetical protein